jgi:hypothetical protein
VKIAGLQFENTVLKVGGGLVTIGLIITAVILIAR